jgi:hypothetical protein
MPAYPDVNGVRNSYASVRFAVEAVEIVGIEAINYRETHEVAKIRGTSAKPQGRTRGVADYEGDIEILQADWKALLPKLTLGGAIGFAERAWPITVAHSELLAPADVVIDTLIGVRFLGPDQALAQGPDATKLKITLSIMRIIWAGRFEGLRGR